MINCQETNIKMTTKQSTSSIKKSIEEKLGKRKKKSSDNLPVKKITLEKNENEPIVPLPESKDGKMIENIQPKKQEMNQNENVPSKPDEIGKRFSEKYLNGYCFRNKESEQYYAKDISNNDMYWKDSAQAQIYAYKKLQLDGSEHKIEYPACKNNGEPEYIYDREGKPRYPIDLENYKVIFPRNPKTNEEEYLTDKMGKIFYPANKFGQQFYRKDIHGNDVIIDNKYAEWSNGTQIYPKNSEGDEFYLKINNEEVAALKKVDSVLESYYARKANGDEIYPRNYFDNEK